VPRNSANVRWTSGSRENVRNNRGENWLLASCSVTTVSENVSDVTVISEPAIADRTVRAASAPPPNRYALSVGGTLSSTFVSTAGVSTPRATASRTPTVGIGHRRLCSASRRTFTRLLAPNAISARPPATLLRQARMDAGLDLAIGVDPDQAATGPEDTTWP